MPFILGVSFYTIILKGFFKRYFTWQTSDREYKYGTENIKESFQIFQAKKFVYISRFAETIPLCHEFKMYIENVKKQSILLLRKTENGLGEI